jgi:hypothetical protein
MGYACCAMANRMVRSPSFFDSPAPGQIFTVGSITWIINPDGEGEIIELDQIGSVPTTRLSAPIYPVTQASARPSSTITCHTLPRCQRRQIKNDDLIEAIDQLDDKLANCLSIAESAWIYSTPGKRYHIGRLNLTNRPEPINVEPASSLPPLRKGVSLGNTQPPDPIWHGVVGISRVTMRPCSNVSASPMPHLLIRWH